MKTKKTKVITDSEKIYQDCVDAVFSLNSLTQDILIPKIFSLPMIYIDKDLLYTNYDKFVKEKATAEKSYQDFLKLIKQKKKQNLLIDDDYVFYNRLDGIMPSFNKAIKEVHFILKHHFEMKKQIEEVTLTQKPNIYPLSFMPTFESMLAGTIASSEGQLDTFIPSLQVRLELDSKTYSRIENVYFSNLELDIVYRDQLKSWKEQKLTKDQKKHIKLLEEMSLYVHQMNADILMSVRMMKSDLMHRTSLMKLYLSALHDDLYLLQTVLTGKIY
ncbi:MAG: hypothetical protein AABZ74_13715 [Cyanobacteriota bacterium]